MAAQLNIKDAETVGLAHALAKRLGKSVTATVRDALRDQSERVAPEPGTDSLDQARALIASLKGHWSPAFDNVELSTEYSDMLYDQDGLPR